MAHKVQSRPAPPAAKKPIEPTGTMTMLMLSGAVLKGVQLPAGAEVAIV